jgi:transposase
MLRSGKLYVGSKSPVKKSLLFSERNLEKRQTFLDEIKDTPLNELVYLDESGINSNLQREFGWSYRGEKIHGEVSGKIRKRFSIIAALNGKDIKAPFIFEGYTDTEVFNNWIAACLVPELKPGQTVILDNASFHKSPKTKSLIEAAGCYLKYLPTYSPDFNPIEQQWAILKARIRKHRMPNEAIENCINTVFEMYY